MYKFSKLESTFLELNAIKNRIRFIQLKCFLFRKSISESNLQPKKKESFVFFFSEKKKGGLNSPYIHTSQAKPSRYVHQSRKVSTDIHQIDYLFIYSISDHETEEIH